MPSNPGALLSPIRPQIPRSFSSVTPKTRRYPVARIVEVHFLLVVGKKSDYFEQEPRVRHLVLFLPTNLFHYNLVRRASQVRICFKTQLLVAVPLIFLHSLFKATSKITVFFLHPPMLWLPYYPLEEPSCSHTRLSQLRDFLIPSEVLVWWNLCRGIVEWLT